MCSTRGRGLSGWLHRVGYRLRRLLGAPSRRLRREHTARKIAAECSSPAELEDDIERLRDDLAAFVKTADYKRSLQKSPRANRYAERADHIEAQLQAYIRAWALLKRRQVRTARQTQARSDGDDAGRGWWERIVESVR